MNKNLQELNEIIKSNKVTEFHCVLSMTIYINMEKVYKIVKYTDSSNFSIFKCNNENLLNDFIGDFALLELPNELREALEYILDEQPSNITFYHYKGDK